MNDQQQQQGMIFKVIPKVAKEIGCVGKDKRNQAQGYSYRSLEDVMDACHGALVNNGVTIIPAVVSETREERQTAKGATMIYSVLKVSYRFFAEDGSSVESIVVGEGMDSGDKSTNKAMSAAYKYAVGQVFSIPFSMEDSEKESPSVSSKKKQEHIPSDLKLAKPEPKPEPAKEQAPAKPKNTTAEDLAEIRRLSIEYGIKTREDYLQTISVLALTPTIKEPTDLTPEQRQLAIAGLKKMIAEKGTEANG